MPGPESTHSPAGSLQAVQSFASTLCEASGQDLLGSREDATGWLRAAGWLPVDAGLTGSEHAALLRLRNAVRDVLAAHASGQEDAGAAARLSKSLAEGRLVVAVGPAGTVQLATAARASYPSVVAAVAEAVADAAYAGLWPPATG